MHFIKAISLGVWSTLLRLVFMSVETVACAERILKSLVKTRLYRGASGRSCSFSKLLKRYRNTLVVEFILKGWGIRTMCDIPFGSFICIYTGVIRQEDDAETNGRVIGDEYFANLNFIESGEATKVEVKRAGHDSGAEDDFDEQSDENDETTSTRV